MLITNNISDRNTCLLDALNLGQAFIIGNGDTIFIKMDHKDKKGMIECDCICEAGLRYFYDEKKVIHYGADTEVKPIILVNIDYKELSC